MKSEYKHKRDSEGQTQKRLSEEMTDTEMSGEDGPRLGNVRSKNVTVSYNIWFWEFLSVKAGTRQTLIFTKSYTRLLLYFNNVYSAFFKFPPSSFFVEPTRPAEKDDTTRRLVMMRPEMYGPKTNSCSITD